MSDAPLPVVERLAALADRGADAGPVVELAVGRRADVASALADRGFDVVATDLHERSVTASVTFVRDDLTDPDPAHYRGASLLYARNLPAELQSPAVDLAATVDAPLVFTTLGVEVPIVPVEAESLQRGTLYRATGGPGPDARP